MASQQDVEQIHLGVEAWNAWRQAHPDHVPDLSEADLLGVDLEQGNLSRANLTRARLGGASLIEADLREAVLISADLSATQAQGANLSGANLRQANLVGANLHATLLHQVNLSRADLLGADFTNASLHAAILWAADLSDANLSEADLSHADLLGTNLSGADLSGADLGGTLFRGTNLQGTSFRQAKIGYTVWSDVNLGLARWLETAQHFGPSTLGMDTLLRSQGQIPEPFLRGAGLTRACFPGLALLTNSSIVYTTCGIIAAQEDLAFSSRLCADLRDQGLRCWLASKSQKERGETESLTDRGEAPYRCDQILLVLSAHALRGTWVANAFAREVQQGQRGQRALFALRLDDAVRQSSEAWAADLRRMRPISDFHDWQQEGLYQKALGALLGQLTASGGKRP